ncbi:hypothetical protein H257_12177 [Aphanomyces astaci]|uniref:Uncharacterized protein n=1 Tax=Aphanomyces astaci TaxID=112090 RepID=W4G197_APHAT|nr:hypothetical protein H257_12177 [Aphanomyces astaci]ETV72819.1 hypothetical protein H257_12177 [Aphanomyces astaci]|eukprot:XP_009837605.1 hypothetical protein H257_12177 [Aphanomyces astaci]
MNSKPGYSLRPRFRRRTPLLDVAFAVLVGGISGVYIFNDTLRKVGMPPSIDEATGGGAASAAADAPTPPFAKD